MTVGSPQRFNVVRDGMRTVGKSGRGESARNDRGHMRLRSVSRSLGRRWRRFGSGVSRDVRSDGSADVIVDGTQSAAQKSGLLLRLLVGVVGPPGAVAAVLFGPSGLLAVAGLRGVGGRTVRFGSGAVGSRGRTIRTRLVSRLSRSVRFGSGTVGSRSRAVGSGSRAVGSRSGTVGSRSRAIGLSGGLIARLPSSMFELAGVKTATIVGLLVVGPLAGFIRNIRGLEPILDFRSLEFALVHRRFILLGSSLRIFKRILGNWVSVTALILGLLI